MSFSLLPLVFASFVAYLASVISLADARNLIAEAIAPSPPIVCSLPDLLGRILLQDVAATHDFPAFDRSAMDGYAVRGGDASVRFRVIGEVQPGRGADLEIRVGECARIFTGAPIPAGASRVLMQEDVRREGEWMHPINPGRESHIRYRGEDVRAGSLLLAAGARIGAGEAAVLAQIGCVEALASAAPRVLHLATGNELVDPRTTPSQGEIRDSNSTLIAALLKQAGAEMVRQERCKDDLDALSGKIRMAPSETWDLLLISGGASVGERDFGLRALRETGFEVVFDKVSMRPGKPLIFAKRGGQSAFVIPGNPVAHFVTFHAAIRGALDRMQGAPPSWPIIKLPVAGPIPLRADARETFWPARVTIHEGDLVVYPLSWRSSGDLFGLIGANGLIRIAPGHAPIPGSEVETLLLGGVV